MRVLLPFLAALALLGAILLSLWRRRLRPRAPAAHPRSAAPTATPAPPVPPVVARAPTAAALESAPRPAVEPIAPAAPTPEDAQRQFDALAFGVPQLGPFPPPEHGRVVNAVLAALEDAVHQSRHLPRRPSIVPELLRATQDEASSRREIAAIIARDPALAADLLRMANSALYRVSPQPVESIDRAVSLLGTQGLRSLVAAAILQPMFRTPAGQFERFPQFTWDHAVLSGHAAETLAALAENEDPFAAQLLALLVALGRIVVFRVALEQYAADPALRPSPEALALLVERQCAPVARRIAAGWELSERLVTALNDQSAPAAVNMSPLGRSIHLGRLLGTLALLAREGRTDPGAAQALARAAGVPPRLLERMWPRLTRS
ncbi:MAG: HDOD domain-containing protein [Steroidobacteraceae bacterium]